MKPTKKALGRGMLVWLTPLVIAIMIGPFRDIWRTLFESVMAVTVAAAAVIFAWRPA